MHGITVSVAILALASFIVLVVNKPLTEVSCPPVSMPEDIGHWDKPDYHLFDDRPLRINTL